MSGVKRKAALSSAIEPSCREELVGRLATTARLQNRRLSVLSMTVILHPEFDMSRDLTIAQRLGASGTQQLIATTAECLLIRCHP
jgi:hypothetical protein